MARSGDGPGAPLTAPRGAGAVLREIARSGLLSVLLHPFASGVSVACLVALVTPFLVAEAIARGVAEQAESSVRAGADLYVSGERFGRPAPLPRAAAETLRALPGVVSVEPRIVGEVALGAASEPVLWVGVDGGRLPDGADLVEGRLWQPGAAGELVVGSELARRLALRVGSVIPPFYRNEKGERLSRVVGVFRADLPVWQAHMVVSSLETAETVFAEEGAATSLLVRCPETYVDALRAKLAQIPSLAPEGAPPLRPRVVSRDEVRALVEQRVHFREGAFALPSVLAFALGVPLLLATTGLGLSERRRETGLLRAVGWGRDEILLRSLVESVTLAALGTAFAVLAAWAWLRLLGGAGVAKLLLPDADASPGFDLPFRLLPEPLLAAAAAACLVTSVGSLLSSWRSANAAPAEAMR